MTKEWRPSVIEGEVLPPAQRHELQTRALNTLPYESPRDLYDRMGGFLARWNVRGRAAASTEIALQFERLLTSYNNLYRSMVSLELTRVDHARAINQLHNLGEILAEDNRQRRSQYALNAKRDHLTHLEMDDRIAELEDRMARRADARAKPDIEETERAPLTPAQRLMQDADLRRDLRQATNAAIERIRREAGGSLTSEDEMEIQRIRDEAERLILHGASER